MGICSSCESTKVATAKLILNDGRLQEYSCPVRVSYVLQKIPAFFICNSDEMDFDDVVKAISENELLQPGQLYFALPLNWLQRRIAAEEMAALAVKASSALTKSGGEKCGCNRKNGTFLFSYEKGVNSTTSLSSSTKVGDISEVGLRRKRSSGGGGGGGGRGKYTYTARLSAIQE